MRTALTMALAIAAAPAVADAVPVRPGFYARADRGCATHGDAARYAALLHVDAEGLSDTAHARRVTRLRSEQGALVVDQRSRDLADGREADLTWVVSVMGPQRFLVLGADAGVDWSGQWEWCGEAIP